MVYVLKWGIGQSDLASFAALLHIFDEEFKHGHISLIIKYFVASRFCHKKSVYRKDFVWGLCPVFIYLFIYFIQNIQKKKKKKKKKKKAQKRQNHSKLD